METHGGHINTGFVTSKFFFETLSANGLHDVALTAINKTDYPSFGHWIAQGATVTWECWDGKESHNHPMFGGGLTWFSRCLAGVNVTKEGAGYRHFEVRPVPSEGLDSVYYSLQSPQGLVSSRVLNEGGKLRQLTVTVPVGSTATVFLPADVSVLKESGQKLPTKKDAKRGILGVSAPQDGTIKVEIEQGKYNFEVE
jgi:alpha-L-rhamnosidase